MKLHPRVPKCGSFGFDCPKFQNTILGERSFGVKLENHKDARRHGPSVRANVRIPELQSHSRGGTHASIPSSLG